MEKRQSAGALQNVAVRRCSHYALAFWMRRCSAAFNYDANDAKGCTGLKPGVTETPDTP
jgi:hypothetical protein